MTQAFPSKMSPLFRLPALAAAVADLDAMRSLLVTVLVPAARRPQVHDDVYSLTVVYDVVCGVQGAYFAARGLAPAVQPAPGQCGEIYADLTGARVQLESALGMNPMDTPAAIRAARDLVTHAAELQMTANDRRSAPS